ncbi:MAG: ABC transporter permease [Gemmatimonadales bacterium]
MDTLLQDIRYAIRSLRRAPALTIATVLTLGLGIGANSAMFGVVDQLYLRPPAHVVDPDRVVRVNVTRTMPPFPTRTNGIATYPRFADFRDRAHLLSGAAAYSGAQFSLGLGEHAERVKGELVTGGFFALLGVRPERGRFFGPDEDKPGTAPHVAVLSHEFWHREFADAPDIVGKTLQLGRVTYTVIGVAPPGFSGIELSQPDIWVPMSAAAPEVAWPGAITCEGCYWLTTIARLAPGASVAQAASEGTVLYRGHVPIGKGNPPTHADSTATVVLSSVHEALGPRPDDAARLAVWLAAVCAVVLLIACANVANLLLARAVQRRREIALRVALGARRSRLIRQLYTESGLLAVTGGAAAVLMTLWAGPVLRAFLLPDAMVAAPIDLRALLFTAGVVLLTTLLAGLAPALHASTPDLSSALKGGNRDGTFQRSLLRSGLLVGQVALTLVLLTGAGLFIRSLRHMQGQRLGFDPDRIIVASVDLESLGYKRPAINALYQEIRERMQRTPGVIGASLSIGTPFQSSWAVDLEVPGLDSFPTLTSGGPYIAAVTPDYFGTMGTIIRKGRAFTDGDNAGGQRVAIVSETFAKVAWPGQDPMGKCLKIGYKGAPCSEVVGVVEDARRGEIKEEVNAQYFIPLAQSDSVFSGGVSSLLVRTAGPAEEMTGAVRRGVQGVSPELPYPNIDPMPQLFADQLRPWLLGSSLFSLFGGLGLLLAAIGLYGVLSYVVFQRTQEMGVRMALGATRGGILRLVIAQGARITAIGVVLGILVALLVGRAMASLLYGVSAHDPVVFISVTIALTAVAITASAIPALRATRVDPMDALRAE